ALKHTFVQVAPPADAVLIDKRPGSRKHVLPPPVRVGVRILAQQRWRNVGGVNADPGVAGALLFPGGEVSAQAPDARLRERSATILAPFAAMYRDLAAVEVDVLDPQRHAFGEPQAAAVHELCAQGPYVVELAENRPDLALTQNNRHSARPFGGDDAVDAG